MHFKDTATAAQVGGGHHHLTVKTARPQQGRVQHVRAVGGGNKDDALVAFKPIHFHQQLVQSLFPLVVAAAQARTALPAHSVNFINKNKTRSVFLALNKEVAHARSAYAHKHLHKIRTGNGKKRHARLTRYGAGQQGFARTGRAHQQYTLGNTTTQPREFFGVGEKLHHFLQFFLGLIHPRHIGKGDARAFLVEHAGA